MTCRPPTTPDGVEKDRERGSVSVEVVLWAPWLFLLALLGVQAVTYGWGYMVARHAADAAAQTTRVDAGTVAAGRADAQAILTQAGGRTLTATAITVTRDPRTTTVTISGSPARVVPLIPLPRIAITVSAPTEMFHPYGATP